jgi:hypothetical protein
MKIAFGPARKTHKLDLAFATVMATTMAFAGGPAQAQAFPPENPPCPTSRLAPFGLAPLSGEHCTTPNCLLTFKGYQWWTSYQYNSAEGFYNGGLRTRFAPEHVSIDGDGNLHLVANKDINLGEGPNLWSGAEAVLMFNGDGSEANLGYGDYLVSARLVNGNWSALDPNMAFGLFTYENPGTGPNVNENCEIDLAEISRWGWNHTGTCPIGGNDNKFPNNILCNGDAQFALQLIRRADDEKKARLMVNRYDIGMNNEVTLVMRWHKGQKKQPEEPDVKFEKYNGMHSLDDLPSAPTNPWAADPNTTPTPPIFTTTPPNTLNEFVPEHTTQSCERFHINFWFGNYSAGKIPNPPPTTMQPQEVIITNFQFRP